MITPAFIFTIFMLTLGPVKTVPAFYVMTQDQAPSDVRVLALKGTAVAPWGVTAILFFADLAYRDPKLLATVTAILLLIMLLNLIGMLLARPLIAAGSGSHLTRRRDDLTSWTCHFSAEFLRLNNPDAINHGRRRKSDIRKW